MAPLKYTGILTAGVISPWGDCRGTPSPLSVKNKPLRLWRQCVSPELQTDGFGCVLRAFLKHYALRRWHASVNRRSSG